YAKAEPLYQRSLKIRESKLGPDHPDVAQSLNNLATLYKAQGQYAQAEPLYQRSLKIWEAKLGPDHPDVALSLNNLALLYAAMEGWNRASIYYSQARRTLRRHIAQVLPLLSEKEQLTFLQTQDEHHLHSCLSLGLVQPSQANLAQLSAGWLLNGKA